MSKRKDFENKMSEIFGTRFAFINANAISIEGEKDDNIIRLMSEKFNFSFLKMRGSATDMNQSALRMIFKAN